MKDMELQILHLTVNLYVSLVSGRDLKKFKV